MKQYASWQAPFYSFWSKSFYRDVTKNWRGAGYGYLFSLICFTCLFMFINIIINIEDHKNATSTTKRQWDISLGHGKRQHVETTTTTTTTTQMQYGINSGTMESHTTSKPGKTHYAVKFSLMDLVRTTDHNFDDIIRQMPTKITIEKGILSMDCPSPRIIKDSQGHLIITFDARTNTPPPNDLTSIVFVTRDALFVDRPLRMNLNVNNFLKFYYAADGPIKLPFSNMENGSFTLSIENPPNPNGNSADLKKWIVLVTYLVLIPFGFIFCVLQSLIYGLLGMLIASLSRIQMSYGTLVRLSTIALTPVLLTDSLLKVFDWNIESWSLLAVVITICYLTFAIRANSTLSE